MRQNHGDAWFVEAAAKRALRVQPFKVGPDYLDTGWHTAICGVASRNLDSFMLPPPVLNALFCEQMRQADIAVIEGVMGLYDGYGVDPNYCSTAAMAKQLGCPVILLVDGKAVSTSLAAIVMGFQHFDPTLNLAGVIVNRVTSDAHYQLLKMPLNIIAHCRYWGMSLLATASHYLNATADYRQRILVNQQSWHDFAASLEQTVDVDALLSLSVLSALPTGMWPERPDNTAGAGLTLALADDEAFNFYYPDNIDLLERAALTLCVLAHCMTAHCLIVR